MTAQFPHAEYSERKCFSRRSESNLNVASAPVFDAEEIVQHLADATSQEVMAVFVGVNLNVTTSRRSLKYLGRNRIISAFSGAG